MARNPEPNSDYPSRMYTNPADYFHGVYVESPLMKPLYYGGLVVIGGIVGAMYNISNKKPVRSGIQMYAGIIGGFLAVGYYGLQRRHRRLMDRDAMFIHYIETHPDEFPPIERKLYKDIFREWTPIR